MEFMREFPDDAACLDRLWRDRFAPDGHTADCARCERPRRFHRTKTRASYTCDSCGLHVHPMAGTIFEKSTTSLQLWFYAIYLVASTRCGISAKQLERELGVTYKTAHRMMKRIRTELMNDGGDDQLSGDVDVDETAWGGRPRTKLTPVEAARFREDKATILGMVERGGRVRLRVISSRRGEPLSRAVRANVNPASMLITDDWRPYRPLRREYIGHRVINHSAGSYVVGDVTRTPSRGSSAISRPACAASTSTSRPGTYSPTWTSTPGATTSATRAGRCSSRSSSGQRLSYQLCAQATGR